MKVLLTGATGYVGQFVGRDLVKKGHSVVALSRQPKTAKLSYPAEKINLEELKSLEGIEAVVHLAGASIAEKRWSSSYKKVLYSSRVDFTKKIIKNLDQKSLKTWVQMSATGFYKPINIESSRKDPKITEDNGVKADSFLGELVEDWEASNDELQVRKTVLRMGMVVGKGSQALDKMAPLFRSGLGAVLGSGKQYMPWVHVLDAVSVIDKALNDESFNGIYNLTSPGRVQNKSFTNSIVEILDAPHILPPAPTFSLKLLYGEMSQILLSSLPVYPKRLVDAGFSFEFSNLKEALKEALPKLETGESSLVRKQWIPKSVDETFEFFQNEKNLEEITPPSLNFKVLKKSTDVLEKGTLIDYKLKINAVPVRWRTLIKTWSPPHSFSDFQIKGPYTKWFHTHTFESLGEGTLMEDVVIYKLPFGFLGRLTALWYVKKDVNKIFNYRFDKVEEIFKDL